jgi:hypothetical protein
VVAIRSALELNAQTARIQFYLKRFPQSRCKSKHGFRFDRLRAIRHFFNPLQLLQSQAISCHAMFCFALLSQHCGVLRLSLPIMVGLQSDTKTTLATIEPACFSSKLVPRRLVQQGIRGEIYTHRNSWPA